MQNPRNRVIKLAFYVAKHGNFLDMLIALFTFGKFSHVELLFDDGMSVSASPRDGGVRSKFIYFEPEKWRIISFEVSSIEYNNIRKYVAKRIGLKYDWAAIFLFGLGLNFGKKYMCTELISEAISLYSNKLDNIRHQITPDTLYTQLTGKKP